MKSIPLICLALFLFSCKKNNKPFTFAQYWFEQGAEIATYQVTYNRYAQKRKAKEVFVFVTEDFNRSKQVKADRQTKDKNVVPILKLNRIMRFTTGIYDYSLMSSVFSAYNREDKSYQDTLKLTTSLQDWCGQSFIQINKKGGQFHNRHFSYFEKIGDKKRVYPKGAILEDSLWTWLRLSPQSIPRGKVKMLPNLQTLYLNAIEPKVYNATISFVDVSNTRSKLLLKYSQLGRILEIEFAKSFPHYIYSYKDVIIKGGKLYSNGAELISLSHSFYWEKSRKKDKSLRRKIKIGKDLF